MSQSERERWQAVQALVDEALEIPTDQRSEFLHGQAGDEALRAEAVRLLASCERAARSDVLLADSAAAFAAPLLHRIDAERVGTAVEAASQGRYMIEHELARGGMATVYAARDRRHDRRVAVKVLEHHVHAGAAGRFLREIRTTARLTHPHLLGLHDSGEAEGLLFYVMPFVDGETLRARLTRDGALPVAEALRLIAEIADALAYAHKHGLIHRDLKPENVLLSNGHAMVADFGIAKALAAAGVDDAAGAVSTPDALATMGGGLLGTPAYMAPEQATAHAPVDHRADLYALGIIAYEMLTGTHPFGRRPAQAMVGAHRDETPAPLAQIRADVPPWMAELIDSLMAKDPAERPQSADEMTRRIEAGDTRASVPLERARPWRQLIPISAALLLLLLAGIYWLRPGSRNAAPASMSALPQLAVPVTTVAVLPFAGAGTSAEYEYLGDGLTDELALALARIPGVRVAGRTSTFSFKGKNVPAQEIGRSLDVGALVTGAARRANGRVRVSIQLVSTTDGKVLWGSVYESRSTDVFKIQDEFTRAVVTALAPALGDRARVAAVQGSRGTTDQEAYDLFLRGRYYWLERGRDNVARSIQELRRAVARDPNFARAHAALSLSYGTYPTYVPEAMDSMAELLTYHAERAVALDSTFADAQLAIGQAVELQLRYRDALHHYQRALALEPSNATVHHWLGMSLVNVGRMDEGLAILRRGTILDPLAKSVGSAYSASLLLARRLPDAVAAARAVLAIDSTFPLPYFMLAMAAAMEGKTDEAVRTIETRRRLAPEMAGSDVVLVYAYASAGRWAEADRIRTRIKDPLDKATVAVFYGDREPLLEVLSTDAGKREWFSRNLFFSCHPYLDPLWTDRRFLSEIERLGVISCKLAQPRRFHPPAERL